MQRLSQHVTIQLLTVLTLAITHTAPPALRLQLCLASAQRSIAQPKTNVVNLHESSLSIRVGLSATVCAPGPPPEVFAAVLSQEQLGDKYDVGRAMPTQLTTHILQQGLPHSHAGIPRQPL